MPKVTISDINGLVQQSGGGMTVNSRLYLGDGQTTTYSGNDGSIPITAAYVKVDAGGSARSGLRFAGTGDAGQLIVVHNAGGEALTFEPGATSLVRGLNGSNDTMEALGTYMFVSDGAFWCLIGGSEKTDQDGMSAS